MSEVTPTPTNADDVTVIQADRDAAADYGLHRLYSGLGAEGIREGRADLDDLVQAFARHRIANQATGEVDLREALRSIFAKLDKGIGQGAPGHAHDVSGIWDADNAPGVAGTQCEWCAQWEAARAALAIKGGE